MSEPIIVGLSGGVDSAVAALKLLEAGHTVRGLFMKNWDEDDHTGQCTALQDLDDAQDVADRLGIALHTVNFAAEYWEQVFEVFLAEYQAGRTPNPDILCNKHIKFHAFLDHARSLGAARIATGHYARSAPGPDGWRLLKGRDAAKDQSYFLYAMGQEALARTLFPLGDMEKTEVRALALRAGFRNARKKDSTGVCFIGERRFREFLPRFLAACPGEIRTPEGRVLGEHPGLMHYTLGQRSGMGIGGVKGAAPEPWYVLRKDTGTNILYVGQGHDHPWLFHGALEASRLDWMSGCPPNAHLRCAAKARYRQDDQPCVLELRDNDTCRVVFDQPQRALTPGQSVVFYEGEACLGGGVIDRALN